MFIFLIILFIVECFGFCFLFYKILEINKEIDSLYNNYSKLLENSLKTNLKAKGSVLK